MTGLGGQQFTIAAAAHRAVVTEVGAGLQRYDHDGVEITCGYADDELPPKGCGTTLVPWPNRLRGGAYTFDGVEQQLALSEADLGNAIHGLGRWTRWTVADEQPDQVTLHLDVVPQKGYPFQVSVDKTYALDADDGLTVTMRASNDGSTGAPFGAGSHPYLSCRGHALDEVTLTLPASEVVLTNEQQIPVGRRPVGDDDFRRGSLLSARRFDQGFTGLEHHDGRAVAQVVTPSGGARLWVDETYRFLQVFTVEGLTAAGAGIAIEPMTCAPDAFNSGDGLIVLEPGQSWTGRWGIVPG